MIRTQIQIRFSDIDSFEHVNNINIQHYYDYGKVIYFRDVLGITGVRSNPSLVIVSTTSNYFLPILFNDSIDVETSVIEYGEKSVTLYQRIIDNNSSEIKSDCTVTMVVFDTVKSCSTDILPSWVEAICKHEGKLISDLKKNK